MRHLETVSVYDPLPTARIVLHTARDWTRVIDLCVARSQPRLNRYTGLCAAALLFVYIPLEAPYSGMSINPGRTFRRRSGPGCGPPRSTTPTSSSSERVPGGGALSDDFAAAGVHPFHVPLGVMLDESSPRRSPCIRCNTCGGAPCLLERWR